MSRHDVLYVDSVQTFLTEVAIVSNGSPVCVQIVTFSVSLLRSSLPSVLVSNGSPICEQVVAFFVALPRCSLSSISPALSRFLSVF